MSLIDQWPYLKAGIDRGLTGTQASILLGTYNDHGALNQAPKRSVKSMLRRCPELFVVISGGGVYPTSLGHSVAGEMYNKWWHYMEEHARKREEM